MTDTSSLPRAEPQLKSQRFRRQREQDWRQLDKLMAKVEARGAAALSDQEILAVPVLYRSTLSALSVARATSLDRSLIVYLETLAARAYFFVYGTRSTLSERIGSFFAVDWPAAVRALWRESLVSFGLMLLGVAVAMALIGHDPDWFYSFVDPNLAAGRDPTASAEMLREGLFDGGGEEGRGWLGVFATFLFTHNAQVCLIAFALGFAFGVPSIISILLNGAMLGAMLSVFISKGLGVEFGGWLAIHGVTELSAITLAGAAGMRIGWAVAFPGDKSRLEAATEAGRVAGVAMGGVIVMLVLAGLLEGFGRQLINDTWLRYAIGAATGVMWALYFYGPRRRRADVSA